MHDNIVAGIRNQMPQFDQAFSRLILDLEQRGLLDSTLVMVSSRVRPHAEDQRDRRPRPLAEGVQRRCSPAAGSRRA